MFLITGITGHVGGAAATQLLTAGRAVRALVREPARAAAWAARGVDVRVGDFNDRASLAAAFVGVEGAFLMMPPQLPSSREFVEARAIAANYRAVLEQTPVPRVVALSSFGSEQPERLGPITSTHILEATLRGTRSPLAFIRAGAFLENLERSVAAAASGRFMTHVTRAIPMVATADIGALVARLLTDDAWRGERVVELGTAYTPDDIAQALTSVAGKPVSPHAIPRGDWRAALVGHGMSPFAAELLEEMRDSQNEGWIAFGAPGAERVPATITLQTFFDGVKRAAGH
jgi:uncharacterized protein YbjT (DUF2867 family)